MRWTDTSHVPHGWGSGLLFEETTGTLLCGDLFTAVGVFAGSTKVDSRYSTRPYSASRSPSVSR